MRKRALARKHVNHDDMWITLPQQVSADAPEVVEAAVRTEQPTYEDTWYQVLRKRDDPASGAPAPAAAGVAAPEENAEPVPPEAPERDAEEDHAPPEEEASDPPAEPDVAPRAEPNVPGRPDLAPQVASSLD
jgi:hypothetical protein